MFKFNRSINLWIDHCAIFKKDTYILPIEKQLIQ